MHTTIIAVIVAVLSCLATWVITTRGHRRRVESAFQSGAETTEYAALAPEVEEPITYESLEPAYEPAYIRGDTAHHDETETYESIFRPRVPSVYQNQSQSHLPLTAIDLDNQDRVTRLCQEMDDDSQIYMARKEAEVAMLRAEFSGTVRAMDVTGPIPATVLAREITVREVVLQGAGTD